MGAASRRHGSYHRTQEIRVVLLTVITLAIPVVVAANPVDPSWIPGLYDDGDGDQLITHAMSPEALIGPTVVALVCILSGAMVVHRRPSWHWRAVIGGASARAPQNRFVGSALSFLLTARRMSPLGVWGSSFADQILRALLIASLFPRRQPLGGFIVPLHATRSREKDGGTADLLGGNPGDRSSACERGGFAYCPRPTDFPTLRREVHR
jgi:hypothetical protein